MSLIHSCRSIVGVSSRALKAPGTSCRSFNRVTVARSFSADQARGSKDDDSLAEGEKLLYKGSQLKPILIMLGISGVNSVYFSSQLAHYVMYKDVVVEGISLAGDPLWGGVGAIATLGILYFTRVFAHNSVYQAYETEDHKRIGFQMHTIIGKPGRKFEVPIGNVRFISKVNQVTRSPAEIAAMPEGFMSKVFSSSYVPMTIDGFDGNVVIDVDGDFKDKERLVSLVNEPEKVLREAKGSAKEEVAAPVTTSPHFRRGKAHKGAKA